ncbi:MAG: hypothetical protein D4R88_01750 [Methanosarcinales archaeon]|nr:MAG: hypothetical protein D4R88_01750 [Methanosarcinales archaeon]
MIRASVSKKTSREECKRLRGKIARAVASKISLAARCDCYSGEIKGNLPKELEKKVTYIRKHAKKSSMKI